MTRLDARRFAADGHDMSGVVQLSAWPRAAESVINPSVAIGYRVSGGADAAGRPRLQVELTGAVDVVCQRCLQPMRLVLEGEATNVLLASNQQQLDAWDSEVEDAEVVLADEPLDLDELLEDEFLLSLPFSPMCDDPGCPKRKQNEAIDAGAPHGSAAPEAGIENPFAALRGKLRSTQPD